MSAAVFPSAWRGGPLLLPAILVLLLALGGCAGVSGQPAWGEDARLLPGWSAVGRAARRAATDPLTWAPILTAGVLTIGDLDEDLSDWAADNTPLFGGNAADISDGLKDASTVVYAVTALIAPSGEHWVVNKLRGLAVGIAAIGATRLLTDAVKSASSRERPNGDDDRSFPSGHASSAAVNTTLAIENLDYVAMPAWARRGSSITLHLLAGATGWARVEGRRHYFSDVLVGFALGHFIGRFMHEAFLESGALVEVGAQPLPGGAVLSFGLSF
ncbi:MAG: phosphatase PAP2 family protein [Nitrococcus sp.]|nr:phosphatase PAP2 family protein [Nitrococcus sp.]